MIDNRNVSIISDEYGKNIVLINDRKFKGLTKEDWNLVEKYLMGYIGDCYEIASCSEKVYISADFPDEYAGSDSRIALKGARRKAKAEAAQAIPEIIQLAVPKDPVWEENREQKHKNDAQNGWYRYFVRFGLPVYDEKTAELVRYNIFQAIMLIRHAADGCKYLYDLTTIKKETSSPPESETVR